MHETIDFNRLTEIMNNQIAYFKDTDTVNLLWTGYLAALSVQGYISAQQYHEQIDTLKSVGREELQVMLAGVSDSQQAG